MAQKADAAGAPVDLGPAAARLGKLASDQLQDPAAINEAKRLLAMIPGGHASITPTRPRKL
jgi:hypothetical protein